MTKYEIYDARSQPKTKSKTKGKNTYKNRAGTQTTSKATPKTSRSYTKTKTQTRRRSGEVPSQEVDLAQKNYRLGSKPKNNFRQLQRFVQSNKSKMVYGYKCLTRFGGTSGYHKLFNNQTATGQELIAPAYLVDVTSSPNIIQGTITLPKTVYMVGFTNETNTADVRFFSPYSGLASATSLSPENTSVSSTTFDAYPNGNSILRWIQCKLMFYGATQEPTKISIQLVRFTDERLMPLTESGTTTVTDAFVTGFYQSLLKKYMYSPIEVSNPQYDKYIKTLWSTTCIINPKETTDNVDTRYRVIDIFKWMNRKCTYQWDDKDKMSLVNSELQINNAQNHTTVHPRARTFLLIRGLSGYVDNSALHDPTKQPSFDMVLRTCHEQLAS